MARHVSRFAGFAAVGFSATVAVGFMTLSPAGAQDTDAANLEVKVKIVPVCKIESVGVLNFGDIGINEEKDTETEITFSCTLRGEYPVTIDVDFGQHATESERYLSKDGSNGDIRYMVCTDSSCATEWTAPVSHTISDGHDSPLTVYARIPAIETGMDLEEGEYTDTLTVTLDY